MGAALSLEASVTVYQSMWPNAPEDLIFKSGEDV